MAKTAIAKVLYKGKTYRCIDLPTYSAAGGKWQWFYKGKWKDMINYQIKIELNKLLKLPYKLISK